LITKGLHFCSSRDIHGTCDGCRDCILNGCFEFVEACKDCCIIAHSESSGGLCLNVRRYHVDSGTDFKELGVYLLGEEAEQLRFTQQAEIFSFL
jgi:hypothetical protein